MSNRKLRLGILLTIACLLGVRCSPDEDKAPDVIYITATPLAVIPLQEPSPIIVTATDPAPPTATLEIIAPSQTSTPPALITQAMPATPTLTSTAFLTSTAVTRFNGQVAQESDRLRLRAEPDDNGRIIELLPALTQLTVIEQTSNGMWYRVNTQYGMTGWVMAQYVELYIDKSSVSIRQEGMPTATLNIPSDFNAEVIAANPGLRLREFPHNEATVLLLLPENSLIRVIGRSSDNAWLQVEAGQDLRGWTVAEFIRLISVEIAQLPVLAEAFTPTPTIFVERALTSTPTIATDQALTPPETLLPEQLPTLGSTPIPASIPPSSTPAPANPTSPPFQPPPPGRVSGAVEIFQRGQTLGNRPNVFSKVGDSITVSGHFLFPIGRGTYNLRGFSQYQAVIDFFSQTIARDTNSFGQPSVAAETGWTTANVLDPTRAFVPPCQPGEIPLVCEYRLTKPSVAIIMLGTNDVLLPTDQYQANLERIVQISIEMGVIPILSTIPLHVGFEDKINTYNRIITDLANRYNVPLIDYYGAMLRLPNLGLNSDGVHPSFVGSDYNNYAPSGDFTAENLQYGYPVRNLLTLQMLDQVWRQVIRPRIN